MFAPFQAYLTSKAAFTQDELKRIESFCIFKKLRKRQYLLQEGDVCRYNSFVSSGFLRTYTVDGKGQEHILNFLPENYWACDRESLTSGNPSIYNIDALENSEIVLISKENFDILGREIPTLNELVNQILHRSFVVSQSRINAAISLSAEERYQNFLQKYSFMVDRIPQHMIASYLGISAETLSRIKSQAAKR